MEAIPDINNESVNIYNEDPYVATYDNFLTDEECQHFIDISKDNLKRAEVSYEKKGGFSSGRTGFNTWLTHNHDVTTHTIGLKIAKLINMPLENAEKFQVIYYGPDQEYKQHYDSWVHDGSYKTLRCMKYGGARLKTALVYLCDVEEGGGTKMTKLNITIMPKKGKLLVFHNTYKDSHIRHPDSEHAGMPVIKGEKYAFNLWFKECNSKMEYKEFNPGYYLLPKNTEDDIIKNGVNTKNELNLAVEDKVELKISNLIANERMVSICDEKYCEIYFLPNLLTSETSDMMVSFCEFSNAKRPSGWIKLSGVPEITTNLLACLNIGNQAVLNYCENINVIEYKPGEIHGPFFDAYNVNTDRGIKYLKNKGQRVLTFTVVLSDDIEISFPKLNISKKCSKGDIILYKNITREITVSSTNNRDPNMEHIIKNLGSDKAYVGNIYVREKDCKGGVIYNLFDLSNLRAPIM